MLKIAIIGNVGKDATCRESKGMTAINFSVAHGEVYKNKDGVKMERTTWLNCTIRKSAGQSTEIAKYLKAGTKVYLEGKPEPTHYKNNEGETVVDFKCNIRTVELLSSRKDDTPAPAGTGTTPTSNTGDDDLPF